MSLKACDNCGKVKCRESQIKNGADITTETNCDYWSKLPCEFCGGMMSVTRGHNGKLYRHCFSCHFESEVSQ